MSVTLAPVQFRLFVPELSPYDPDHALSLEAACRLGLVPGRCGRRLTADELLAWATDGYSPFADGPRFIFPTIVDGGRRMTTADWCAAWVAFLAEARESSAFGDGEVRAAPDLYNTGDVL